MHQCLPVAGQLMERTLSVWAIYPTGLTIGDPSLLTTTSINHAIKKKRGESSVIRTKKIAGLDIAAT